MPEPRRRATRSSPPPAPSLADLARGPLDALARLSGVERAIGGLERLAASADRTAKILDRLDPERLERLVDAAERAADMLDRLDEELGVDGTLRALSQLEVLTRTTEEMGRSLQSIERFLLDTRAVLEPLDRLPIPRALRRSRRGKPESE